MSGLPGSPRRRSTRHLDPDKVVQTLGQLQARIESRFPDSGLSAVCADLALAERSTERRARRLSRPFIALRLFVGLIPLAAVAGEVSVAMPIDWRGVLLEERGRQGCTPTLNGAT